MSDAEFLAAFESCRLPKPEWTHAAHLRMAWLYLRAFPFPAALQRIRSGIQRYNLSLGNKTGYNETVTHAYARLIFSRRPREWRGFGDFIDRNGDLRSKEKPALHAFYRPATIKSSAAHRGFVEPDIAPLPSVGLLRWAEPSDGAALAGIYRPFVAGGAITFESAAPGAQEMGSRVRKTLGSFPWLVAELDGRAAGYAYASRYRERAAYRWCVETSVYVDPAFHRRGVARALYAPLLGCLERQGFAAAYAVITVPNKASVAFHEKLGFKPLTVYRGVGFKLGAWRDVGWWQLDLAPRSKKPSDPLPLKAVARAVECELLGYAAF